MVNIIAQLPVSNNIAELPGLGLDMLITLNVARCLKIVLDE